MTHNRRHRLAERDGWLCCWCSTPLRCQKCEPNGDVAAATIEHMIRRAEGGDDDMDNLKLACMPCNSQRHNIKQTRKIRTSETKRSGPPEPKMWDPIRRRFRLTEQWVDIARIPGHLVSLPVLPDGCPVCGLHNGYHDRAAHRLDRRIVP